MELRQKGKIMTKVPTLEEMLKAGMHFGHRTSKWHPKMGPYIFTEKKGIHIINLAKSQKMMGVALDFMAKLTAEGKVVLFVGTKSQVKKPLQTMAEEIGMPYIVGKWLGGCLTNFAIIKKSIKKYQELLGDKESGRMSRYTKKERGVYDKEIGKLELKVGGLTKLTKLPDAVFVWDIKEEKTAVLEAKKKNIPVIAVCDTNVNPKDINYIIPSNDDATKTIKLVLKYIKEAIQGAKNENKK